MSVEMEHNSTRLKSYLAIKPATHLNDGQERGSLQAIRHSSSNPPIAYTSPVLEFSFIYAVLKKIETHQIC